MRAIYKTKIKECPDSNKRLKAYRSDSREIISTGMGNSLQRIAH
jgi:hypothetical protein